MVNIAVVYRHLERYDEALDSCEKSLKISVKLFGTEEHPDVASTLNNIGALYGILGRNEEALVKFERALAIYRNIYKTDELISIFYNLGKIVTVLKKLGHNHVFVGCEDAPKKFLNHEFIANTLINIASVYDYLGRHKESLLNYVNSLKILKTNEFTPHQFSCHSFQHIFSKMDHLHLFKEKKNDSFEICYGHFLFGKCAADSRNVYSYFSCSECEFDYNLCEFCLYEFENKKRFTKSHEHHSFRRLHLENDGNVTAKSAWKSL